jgi:hypothetical protein
LKRLGISAGMEQADAALKANFASFLEQISRSGRLQCKR